ncbi:hypothetical protein [Nakamurella leprariae]|uniref:Uncharacterized protein n=1 Tax=Nakamurella leprariae TaxID=2803911 RepID=A0A938YAH2_9ACTN|nr:hypothetical protein [Nakamurella leprariae]MBM9468946.1 hypothetical protein [Nakamurella leprariae]
MDRPMSRRPWWTTGATAADARRSLILPALGVVTFAAIVLMGDRSWIAIAFLALAAAFLLAAMATVRLYRRRPELQRPGAPAPTRHAALQRAVRPERRQRDEGP